MLGEIKEDEVGHRRRTNEEIRMYNFCTRIGSIYGGEIQKDSENGDRQQEWLRKGLQKICMPEQSEREEYMLGCCYDGFKILSYTTDFVVVVRKYFIQTF